MSLRRSRWERSISLYAATRFSEWALARRLDDRVGPVGLGRERQVTARWDEQVLVAVPRLIARPCVGVTQKRSFFDVGVEKGHGSILLPSGPGSATLGACTTHHPPDAARFRHRRPQSVVAWQRRSILRVPESMILGTLHTWLQGCEYSASRRSSSSQMASRG